MSANAVYADLFRPSTKVWACVYDCFLITAGSIAIGLSAQVYIGWPVPITGQTFAVLFIAALYGANRGAATVLAYLAEGLLGLPVFTRGQCGIATILGPTGGYLFGFILAAYMVGLLAQKGFDRSFGKTFFAMILGNCLILAFGVIWLFLLASAGKISANYTHVLEIGLYPFIAGDVIKSLFASALLPAGWRMLSKIRPR